MTESEWRKRKKAAHICRDCGKQDAYTLGGRTYCAECAEKGAAKKRAWREANREIDSARHKAFREKKAQSGLCIYCGQRRTEAGRRTCKLCISKNQKKRREKQIAEGMNWPRGANGSCWLCNKRMVLEGKRLCQPCFDKRMKSLTPEAAARGRETQRKKKALEMIR